MARNVVQFQKGLSEPAFEQQYRSPRSNAGQSSLRHAGRVALNARHAVAGGPRGDNPPSLSVRQVPPADVADRRDDLCIDPSAAAAMVSGDLSPDTGFRQRSRHRNLGDWFLLA